jgi:adenylyltransferase/sulfurtransferase
MLPTGSVPDPSDAPLGPAEQALVRRYGRQLILPGIGLSGQRRLSGARVLIVGLGGLGSPAALYLAAAGVGEMHLMDPDSVELSNLHRQILYTESDVGRPKAEAAASRLRALNPEIRILPDPRAFERSGALERVAAVDVVVDASDNFPTRYLINDACVRVGRPDVFAAVHRLEGQAAVFDARSGPCYRCLFPDPPPPDAVPGCGEAGVLGVVPGLLGTLQATEALRLLLGWKAEGEGRLLLVDAETAEFREVKVRRRPDCEGCSSAAVASPLPESFAPIVPGPSGAFEFVAPLTLKEELSGDLPPTLVDVRTEAERAIVRLPGSVWIPLEHLASRLPEIASARRPVVYCQWGGRSERAGRLMAEAGLRPVRVLRGGLDAYAAEADPSMLRL